jgi:transcription antitermination factor NusG
MHCVTTVVPLEAGGSLPVGDIPRNWFALYTRTHHEKRVVEHLKQRGIESYLPLYQAVHTWTHYRKVTLDLPLFPNYLFVLIAPHERVRILEVSGALSFAGNASGPSSLEASEIYSLRSALQLRKCEPHPYLTAGTRARIVAGPFAGVAFEWFSPSNSSCRVCRSKCMPTNWSLAAQFYATENPRTSHV